jgi:hypothetical protein
MEVQQATNASTCIGFDRDGADYILTAQQWLPRSPQEVFAFMSDCRHMNLVLPSWIRLNVLNKCPARLSPGACYDYRFKLHGLPLRWRTRITQVAAPHRFIDVQERGPYAFFEHEHRFEPAGDGTLVHDTIRYRPPGGPLAGMIDRAWVRRDLLGLFEHRHRRLAELYADAQDPLTLLGAPLR